jgi:hypothetical protein
MADNEPVTRTTDRAIDKVNNRVVGKADKDPNEKLAEAIRATRRTR